MPKAFQALACRSTRLGVLDVLFRTSLLNRSSLLGAIACLVFAAGSAQSAPVNKCVVDGTVTYQQAFCKTDAPRNDPSVDELNALQKKRRAASASTPPAQASTTGNPPGGAYRCDGRRHCSQMKSCAEAKYFLANCPGAMMDGDGDGIPCEEQWCGGP